MTSNAQTINMSNRDKYLLKSIKEHEGFRSKPYRCSSDKLTIGYGFNLDAGISREIAEAILNLQVKDIHNRLNRVGWYQDLSATRQGVITEMAFQLGMSGMLSFKKMIAALKEQDYTEASKQMLDSKWHKQTPKRCEKLSAVMHVDRW